MASTPPPVLGTVLSKENPARWKSEAGVLVGVTQESQQESRTVGIHAANRCWECRTVVIYAANRCCADIFFVFWEAGPCLAQLGTTAPG